MVASRAYNQANCTLMSYFEHSEFWEGLNDTQKIVALYSSALPLFELYDAICSEEAPFERPDSGVIELCGRLKVASLRPVLELPPKYLCIVDFPYLEGNTDDIRREWFDCKPKFQQYLQELKNEIINRGADPNKHYKDVLLSAAYNHIQNYRQLKESKRRWVEHKQIKQNSANEYPRNYYFKDNSYFMGDTNHVLRFEEGSIQGKIMKLLDDRKGDFVDSIIIARRTRLKTASEARRAVTAIRSRLKRNKRLANRLKIINVKYKGYQLMPLVNDK